MKNEYKTIYPWWKLIFFRAVPPHVWDAHHIKRNSFIFTFIVRFVICVKRRRPVKKFIESFNMHQFHLPSGYSHLWQAIFIMNFLHLQYGDAMHLLTFIISIVYGSVGLWVCGKDRFHYAFNTTMYRLIMHVTIEWLFNIFNSYKLNRVCIKFFWVPCEYFSKIFKPNRSMHFD